MDERTEPPRSLCQGGSRDLWRPPDWCREVFHCPTHGAALVPVSPHTYERINAHTRRREWLWCCERTLACKAVPEPLLLTRLAAAAGVPEDARRGYKELARLLRRLRRLYLWLWADPERLARWGSPFTKALAALDQTQSVV